ncbi:MAG: 2OG-Fe dioxygenase family protein [Proteobacteria bacterium]|uniref:2OG-Fe dioxygenase family protein n=1 Tax=Aquabacterium sp. TaxID=1872578 RepID=UPI0035C6BBDB|nr:2OG-Fe dioxygenase family protein [Pseudomonadota bacterium]
MRSLPPPARLDDVSTALRRDGWALMPRDMLLGCLPASPSDADTVHASWSDLPPDTHLRDGGRYRFRRHSCFVLDNARGTLTQTPHRAHWQPVTYNALHGGFERWFEPVLPAVCQHPMWQALLQRLGALLAGIKPVPAWFIEAHQFRVDTAGGIGRPTPEGAHRDGVDFVAVIMLERHGIKGGETRVFEAQGPQGVRFTLSEPWSVLLLDDERVIHESTPIQPLGEHGWRDTLVLTFRQGGFQGP